MALVPGVAWWPQLSPGNRGAFDVGVIIKAPWIEPGNVW